MNQTYSIKHKIRAYATSVFLRFWTANEDIGTPGTSLIQEVVIEKDSTG